MNTAVLIAIVIGVVLVAVFTVAIFSRAESQKVKADVWDEAYQQGVHDEMTSQYWTNGEYPPKRQNPYKKVGK